jgi:hypothetical protein
MRPPHPVDVPLTDIMEFTARDGTVWCAWVEALPGTDPWPRRTAGKLPSRHLRFESARGARSTAPVPAGAPFLSQSRLQALLDRSAPLVVPASGPAPARDGWDRARRAAARAAVLLREGRRAVEGPAAAVADRAIGFIAALLERTRARP